MIRRIDPADDQLTDRIVEIQRAAYTVEAELIGFDRIPVLQETAADVRHQRGLTWLGAFVDDALAGVIAWTQDGDTVDIDRLAIDPAFARRGLGRGLVRAVPAARETTVSTGAANAPAVALYVGEGFTRGEDTELAPGVFMAHFRRRRT
ncbi:MAG: GNAT family N-acetyltransferase [Acidimicrobiales bacterium]|nr:GNAT family N-acetyltransferase [Acidimicrobiales bacterium]